ncbi:hypothetical protein Dda_3559 [Drechslerella dactyloides]|uniref:Uncharacterized protein n=1 Tax=Drechslerella dactyloides TaxID=74499 RepID=A0AAD6IY57_DREDA|nr:hypothetical protein Dda_3559 [Drechslerella dactyloides]
MQIVMCAAKYWRPHDQPSVRLFAGDILPTHPSFSESPVDIILLGEDRSKAWKLAGNRHE